MNQRIDNQKNALQINLTSHKQAALSHQMAAAWAVDHTLVITKNKRESWLVRLLERFNLSSNYSDSACQSRCDCQTAYDC